MFGQLRIAVGGRRESLKPLEERWGRVNDGDAPHPTADVAAAHEVSTETVGDVEVVWLDPGLAEERGALLFLPGGGYVSGPLPQQWDWLSHIARAAGIAAAMVKYPLAPAAVYPQALDAVVPALEKLAPSRWVLGGDSAGGGLALAALGRLRTAAALPDAALLLTPWLDLTLSHPGIRRTRWLTDPMMSRSLLRRAAAAYAGGERLDNPEVSPLHADAAGLPPVHLCCGTGDLMIHDVRTMHAKLCAADVDVTYVEQPFGFHDYPLFPAFPGAARARASQVAFLRTVLRRS